MSVRTIALAIDGMEPSLLTRWIDSGELPNLRRIRDTGASGTLQCSSLSSAKQWTTHFTGVSPDRHGVTGFTKTGPGRRTGEDAPDTKELINLSDIRVKTYPELLDERGVSVGLLNPLPLWPPLDLDHGFCVSGMLTPPTSDRWADPESLGTELEDRGYRIDVRYGSRPYGFVDDGVFGEVDIRTIQQDLFDLLDARITAAKYTIVERPTELLYVLFKSIDVFQHCFWAHMENGDEEFGDTILKAYRRIDSFVGWLHEAVDCNMVVFCDHGFKRRPTEAPRSVETVARWIDARAPIPGHVARAYRTVITRVADYTGGDDSHGEDAGKLTGVHGNPGGWLLAGPDVISASEVEATFEDVTPTILGLLDEPIPTEYVGSPVETVIDRTPGTTNVSLAIRRDPVVSDDEIVSERLHNLGYAEMVDESD